jgi:hypothetical protein
MKIKAPRGVSISKKGQTITVTFGSRTIKAKINPIRNRYRLTENGKVLVGDYMGNIKNLCYSLKNHSI